MGIACLLYRLLINGLAVITGGGRQKRRLSLTVDNLFNKLYKEYTNRSRYYAHDMGRDVRLQVNWLF